MAARKGSFVINLRLRKSSSTVEVHDTILEELIRAGDEKAERDQVKTLSNGTSSIIRNLPFDATLIKSVAFSPPYLALVLNSGKACRYKIVNGGDDATESLLGENFSSSSSPFLRRIAIFGLARMRGIIWIQLDINMIMANTNSNNKSQS